MAFTSTVGRYASFGTVATIPGEVIDAFWYIIDNHLKGVFSLGNLLNFELINQRGKLSIRFSQEDDAFTEIVVDFEYPFDPAWPRLFHAVDQMGRETIMTPSEI